MNMNKNRDWLIRKAEQEDGCFVSVGGLVDALEQAEQTSSNVIPFKHAFARFLQLARRDRKLSLEQFAKKVDVDLAELLKLETDDQYTPAIRTVHQIAEFLRRMQIGGGGQRIGAVELGHAIEQSAGLHWSLLRYGHAFVVQMGYTALANGRSKIEERLARWLLMAHDRVDGDLVPLTHEFLATMLGVQRPGVTVALGLLENKGLIQAERGVVSIADRKGLEEISNGAYGAPEAEFRRLFG